MNRRLFYLFFLLLSITTAFVHAQEAEINLPLSHADSLRFNKYLKGANESRLYSHRHQLYLDSILMLLPTNAYYWQQKAMPLYKQHKYEAGAAYLDSAVKYDTNNQYLQYRAFMKCVFQKNYSAAIADFEAAKKRDGFSFVMDHSYDFYMGLCFLQLNQFSRADSLFEHSIAWNIANKHDGHYLEYYYRGIALMEQEKNDQALAYFDSCLTRYAHFPDAKFHKARCLEDLGRMKEAKQISNEALADFRAGYINNEDNSFYEDYPYQPRKILFENRVEYFNRMK